MKKFRTHYDNLNVARNADIAVIKAAYKALAQKYHPDKNPNNPNTQKIMQVINKAYEVLSDPIKRAEHDRWIAEQEKKAEQSYQNNQNSHAYQNTANGSSSASHSNERASQNTHNQTNGYQRYYEYANGNQDNRNYHNYRNDKHNSNNHKKHHDQHNKQTVNKPSFWSFGRMRRTTYILLSIPTIFILVIVRIGIQGGLDLSSSLPSSEYLLLATMIELVPWSFLVFIGIKRLHDCDYKGWWILVPFVVAVIWFVRPTQGTNRFGADPRDGYFYDEIEVKKDNSFWGVVVIALLYNFALISKVIDKQNQAINYQDNTTYQDNQSNNIQTPSISPDDIKTPSISPNDIKMPNLNHQPQLNPHLVLAEAQKQYDNAVANINAVWNSLHPSTQDFLRDEQRAINKQREADCTAYGNAQSSDKDLAKAYRYLCEVLQLNERAEYLKTQLNTVVTPPEPKNVGPAYYQNQQSSQNGYHLNDLINDTVKKSLLFLDRDSASYDGYSHKLESQDITYADVNNDGIKDAVVALRYCEVANCHMTTKSSELAVYLGVGNNQYLYGDIRTLGIDLSIRVAHDGVINTQSKYYSEHEDPACCPSMVINNSFVFNHSKLNEIY